MSLKNLFASYIFYPAVEKHQKRDILSKVKEIRRHYNRDFQQRELAARKMLIETLKWSKHNVPYYRDVFRKSGFHPEKLNDDISYFYELPLLTKDIILEQGNRLVAEGAFEHITYPCKTGGSTGKKVIIHYDQEASDYSAAVTLFARSLCGKKMHHRELHFASMFSGIPPFRDRLKESLKTFALNRSNIFLIPWMTKRSWPYGKT